MSFKEQEVMNSAVPVADRTAEFLSIILVALQKFFVNCKTARESRASSTAPTNPKIPYGVGLSYSIRHPDARFLCQNEQGFFLAKESSICNQSCVLTADFRI